MTHDENLNLYLELRKTLHAHLNMMEQAVKQAKDRGFSLGRPYMCVMVDILDVEAQMQAIHLQLYGTRYPSADQPTCTTTCTT